jgi:DNA-directed RNA polymerase specialized sigma24 family protein
MLQLMELSASTSRSEWRAAVATAPRNDPTFAEAIDALPGALRDIVWLRDVDRVNASTIATKLGIDTAQVRVALQNARRAVRQRLLDQPVMGVTSAPAHP